MNDRFAWTIDVDGERIRPGLNRSARLANRREPIQARSWVENQPGYQIRLALLATSIGLWALILLTFRQLAG